MHCSLTFVQVTEVAQLLCNGWDFNQNVVKKHYSPSLSLFLPWLWWRGWLWAFHGFLWLPLIQPRSRPGNQVVGHSWWKLSPVLTDAFLFRHVRVRLWRLWVKRRKRGRSGKLGGKSCLCFRTAKKGNLVVFPISVYPSLNNLKISAFSKVRYPNERREK